MQLLQFGMVNLKREGGKTGETPPAKNPAGAGKKYPVLDISQQGLQQMMGPVQRNLEEFGFEAVTMMTEEEMQYRKGRQQRLENLKRFLEPHLTGNPGFNANTLKKAKTWKELTHSCEGSWFKIQEILKNAGIKESATPMVKNGNLMLRLLARNRFFITDKEMDGEWILPEAFVPLQETGSSASASGLHAGLSQSKAAVKAPPARPKKLLSPKTPPDLLRLAQAKNGLNPNETQENQNMTQLSVMDQIVDHIVTQENQDQNQYHLSGNFDYPTPPSKTPVTYLKKEPNGGTRTPMVKEEPKVAGGLEDWLMEEPVSSKHWIDFWALDDSAIAEQAV